MRRRWVRTILALLLPALLMAAAPVAHAEDRTATINRDLNRIGVYLDDAFATDDPALWRDRLESAATAVDLPVLMGLWVPVEGVPPTRQNGETRIKELGPLPDGLLVVPSIYGATVDQVGRVDEADAVVVDGMVAQTDDVEAALRDRLPDAEPYPQLTSVAWSWIFLRLLAPGASPTAVVEDLAGDTSLFIDSRRAPDRSMDDVALFSPVTIGTAILVVLATIALSGWLFLVEHRQRRRDQQDPPTKAPGWVAELDSARLNSDLADLAEALAASPLQPGDRTFDRAQSCADAAARYVDSPRTRDRVGAHLLIEDGGAILAGAEPKPRCYFNPNHSGSARLRRDAVVIPSCEICASRVTGGNHPRTLWLPEIDDGVDGPDFEPYYERDDVWTRTGYGSLDGHFARRALLASFEEVR